MHHIRRVRGPSGEPKRWPVIALQIALGAACGCRAHSVLFYASPASARAQLCISFECRLPGSPQPRKVHTLAKSRMLFAMEIAVTAWLPASQRAPSAEI